MNKLPEQIEILGVMFKVREVPVVNKDSLAKGEIDYLACEITIDESMPQDLKMQTLFHEIMHAICDLTGNYEIGENENAVQGLATAMYCVLKANPKILELNDPEEGAKKFKAYLRESFQELYKET